MRGDSPQCGEMSRSDRGARPRKRSRAAGEGWPGGQKSTPNHPSVTFGDSFPQGKPFVSVGANIVRPQESHVTAKLPGRIWNPPLRFARKVALIARLPGASALGGARCAPPSGRLGSSGTFLLLFWSQKSRNKWVEALYKRGAPQGGDTRWETAAATISNSSR